MSVKLFNKYEMIFLFDTLLFISCWFIKLVYFIHECNIHNIMHFIVMVKLFKQIKKMYCTYLSLRAIYLREFTWLRYPKSWDHLIWNSRKITNVVPTALLKHQPVNPLLFNSHTLYNLHCNFKSANFWEQIYVWFDEIKI